VAAVILLDKSSVAAQSKMKAKRTGKKRIDVNANAKKNTSLRSAPGKKAARRAVSAPRGQSIPKHGQAPEPASALTETRSHQWSIPIAGMGASAGGLESFVYTIVHDLRAPLRAMQGFSTMLLEEAGASLSERGQEYAKRINHSAKFMDALLKDLLAFSQLSQQQLDFRPVNLEGVVRTTLAQLEKEIEGKNARIEAVPPWPAVRAHEPTLRQVLINLISNALKFVRPGVQPHVRIYTKEDDQTVRVWVEDNGIGIAREFLEKIFQIFLRLHGDDYPGTGIGLAIVQKGVERMGGRVGGESTPGQGSRFWIELLKA
jgi:signal transduction histidine kinase